MGSDWTWELWTPAEAEPALRELYALAAERDLSPRRPDGAINLFGTDFRTVTDFAVAVAAMATGTEHGQFWTNGNVDVFVSFRGGALTWSLDSAFCYRRPMPGADEFRELHARLTDLWLATAQRFDATVGRVLDEWSSEQAWDSGTDHAVDPAGGWPAELGWSTYLGPGLGLPAPPSAEIADRTRRLANGALLITLLDDPAAVDVLRYEEIHTVWGRFVKPDDCRRASMGMRGGSAI